MSKQKPTWLLALGRDDFPETIEAGGSTYRLTQPFKHDFFAATAKYEGDAGKVVAKFGRRISMFGLPMHWIGTWLTRREARMYRALADMDTVPELIDLVDGNLLVHEYIEGHPLEKGEYVPDDYFGLLRAAVEEIHSRDMAYVDLEKCENVLVGDDGKPYLFDFQIAFHWPKKYGGNLWPARYLLRKFQRGDWYHVTKLQRRTRKDQLSQEELDASYRKPWYIHVHRWMIYPFQTVRRAVLNRIDPKRGGERGRVK